MICVMSCTNFANKILIQLIKGYQWLLSPVLGQSCRFYPSCSQYAVEAIHQHGALHGGWLILRRICRCHPWHAGGCDPVPVKSAGRKK